MPEAPNPANENNIFSCNNEDYQSLRNMNIVLKLLPHLLQLCLECWVLDRAPSAAEFIRDDYTDSVWSKKVETVIKLTKWYDRRKNIYINYRGLDVTNTMETFTEVTKKEKNQSNQQLFKSLNDIRTLRNDVIHNRGICSSPTTMSEISAAVDKTVEELGKVFSLSSKEVILFQGIFQAEIHEISKANEFELIDKIKQCLLHEVLRKWSQIVSKSMKSITLPESNGQVCLSDIFHAPDFEVISDPYKPGDHDPRNSFPCKDIFSPENVANVDIIEGDLGSGKSTFLKKVCLEFCEIEKRNSDFEFSSISSYELMFYFNCHETTLNSDSFWKYFMTKYSEVAKQFSEYWVIKALRDLKIIIAIDGLDECNTASEELVKDIIEIFTDSDKVKFLITTRPGFRKKVLKQFESQTIEPRVLNIKPIQDIKDQEKFINRVIDQLPEVNAEEILKAFNDEQPKLNSHFVRPLGLILFITLFNSVNDKNRKLSYELDLMEHTFQRLKENMSDRMLKVVNCDERATLIMEMVGRNCLHWVQNRTYQINDSMFDMLKCKAFKELFANDGGSEVSVASILSCVFPQQECTNKTKTYNFFHQSQREYLASKVLADKLVHTRNGTVREILQELTEPPTTVRSEDLVR